jgi:hypothetical protein
VLDVRGANGTESLRTKGWRSRLLACGTKNPLGNLRKMALQEVNTASMIFVCYTQAGTAAHALHIDCKTVLGPWVRFQSWETLDRALVYLGATDGQMKEHRDQMRRCGQGSSQVRLLPLRKNLFRIDWTRL